MNEWREFPTTRYQGSKRTLLPWLEAQTRALSFQSVLDLFSGTGCVGYLWKTRGKSVATNDALQFNAVIARALIENSRETLSPDTLREVLSRDANNAPDFIERTFENVYFLSEENRWLDRAVYNIQRNLKGYSRDLAMFSLYQACLAKRPYNLFHRANLSMRTSDVKRGFGNKATWETPFETLMLRALEQANKAVFDNGVAHRAYAGDCLEVPGSYDLIYMDPPYIRADGAHVDYRGFYHFLEGLTEYENWPLRVDAKRRHRPYRSEQSVWSRRETIARGFHSVFERYRESQWVISYRDDGVPSVDELVQMAKQHGRKRVTVHRVSKQYALAKASGHEVLIVCDDAKSTGGSVP